MRSIPQAVVDLIKNSEQCVPFVYDDAYYPPRRYVAGRKVKGCLTAGYGHTGKELADYIGFPIPQSIIDDWLVSDLKQASFELGSKVPLEVIAELTDNQYSALLDFVFNAGTGNPKKKEWTIWGRLRKREFDQVPIELARFVNDVRPDGSVKKLDGLVKRRNEEIALWSKCEPGSVEETPPSSVTRRSETPPTEADPTPLAKNPALVLGAVGAVASAQPAIDQISKVIQPYSEHNDYVQKAYGFLMLIGAICAAASIVYIWLQHRKAKS